MLKRCCVSSARNSNLASLRWPSNQEVKPGLPSKAVSEFAFKRQCWEHVTNRTSYAAIVEYVNVACSVKCWCQTVCEHINNKYETCLQLQTRLCSFRAMLPYVCRIMRLSALLNENCLQLASQMGEYSRAVKHAARGREQALCTAMQSVINCSQVIFYVTITVWPYTVTITTQT